MKKSKIFSSIGDVFDSDTERWSCEGSRYRQNLSGCRSGKEWYRDRFL